MLVTGFCLPGLEEVTRTILGKDVSSTLLQPFYSELFFLLFKSLLFQSL